MWCPSSPARPACSTWRTSCCSCCCYRNQRPRARPPVPGLVGLGSASSLRSPFEGLGLRMWPPVNLKPGASGRDLAGQHALALLRRVGAPGPLLDGEPVVLVWGRGGGEVDVGGPRAVDAEGPGAHLGAVIA